MTPERYEEVERVCQAALDVPADQRPGFLDEACKGDPVLRKEVEALLAGGSTAGSFLEIPAALGSTPAAAALPPGSRLGPYEILSLIAEGGMGQVYRARDSRLRRVVAIKVLPPTFAADAERRARLEREAKAIGALTHPHICTLYDVGQHEGSTFLVMEHLDGETLADRLRRGHVPVDQALVIGVAIAEALSAAHREGVVHRDLKPGNVMLTKAGAKLLDFGLATPADDEAVGSAKARNTSLTAEGVIVGTVQYMAPEQLEGKKADARTDLWALGAVLYEMLAGRPAFAGDSTASLMGNIMNAEPPAIDVQQAAVPLPLDRLIRQCLAKIPDDRPDTAHDVANQLKWVREAITPAPRTVTRVDRRWRLAAAAAAALLLILLSVGFWWLLEPRVPTLAVVRSSLAVHPAQRVSNGGWSLLPDAIPTPAGSRTAFAWTPDGRSLIFVGRRDAAQQLYARRLDRDEAQALAGTEDAQVPAVSPDGRWVAFWARGVIKKVPLAGGPPADIFSTRTFSPFGMAWDEGGGVYVGRNEEGIWWIPANGKARAVTRVGDGEYGHVLPAVLPGGRALVFTVTTGKQTWNSAEVVAQVLKTGARVPLLRDAADARYLSTGHILFMRRRMLYAAAFDPVALRLTGPEVPVLDHVAQSLNGYNSYDLTGAGQFAVSPAGSLAWLSDIGTSQPRTELAVVDRRGQVTVLPAPPADYHNPRISPDARTLAVMVQTDTERGLWLYDLERGASVPLNLEGEIDWPTWWPDGRHLVFAWLRHGRYVLGMQSADGSDRPREIAAGDMGPSSITPYGHLAVVQHPAETQYDIGVGPVVNGQAELRTLLGAPYVEYWPEFSPDGRWLLYVSNPSGEAEIYVRPYPGTGGAVLVSTAGGGIAPAWNRNGREIFFLGQVDAASNREMLAVDFAAGTPPRLGRPRTLFKFNRRELAIDCYPVRCYDVAPDGSRFYGILARWPPAPVVTHVNLVENWTAELKAKLAGFAK